MFIGQPAENTPKSNFDLLWRIVDERYCFFEEKKINWDSIYKEYVRDLNMYYEDYNTYPESLFNLMTLMLNELQDGHVSISNGSETHTYIEWYSRYPDNYNESLIYYYLNRRTVNIGTSLSLTILPEGIAYIRCQSFSDRIDRYALDDALASCSGLKGVIIDIRNNGGGLVSEAYMLASRFALQKTHVGYVRYKTGKGHNDFSEYFERHVEQDGAHPFTGKVVVITNRRVYSAANLFASIMKALPQAYLLGDRTGGGGGIPISTELYNGWKVELSVNPVYDIHKNSLELGVAPHENIELKSDGQGVGKHPEDNIIERGKFWIIYGY